MSGPFSLGLRLDDGPGPIAGSARARPRPVRPRAAIRFDYPSLETPVATEPPPAAVVALAPPPPAAPTFSAEELRAAVETARQEAVAATEVKLRAETLASLEHRQAEALSAIRERLAASRETLERMVAARAGASRDLALALARALAAKALTRQPLADIEAMIRELVTRLDGMPWLELRLPPDLLDAGEAALARAADEAGYRGEIRVMPDARLGPGDARLIWQDGAAERDLASLEAEVVALVDAWLPAADHHASGSRPQATTAVGCDNRPAQFEPEHRLQAPATTFGPAPRPADLDGAGRGEFE
jgi:flagellar assembly protein FliH